MKHRYLTLIGLLLFYLPNTTPGQCREAAPIPDALIGKRVIFLGESHDSSVDHKGQAEVLRLLASRQSKPIIVIAEMFNEQGAEEVERFNDLTQYRDFDTNFWKQQWGHPYELYRPIFELVKSRKLSLAHLRPDPKKTKLVKQEGAVAALSLIGEIFLGPKAYRDKLAEIALKHLPPGSGDEALSQSMLDQFFLVQCFWDEYMSWRIAELAALEPEAILVVLVGHGHLDPQFGIPHRLARRAPDLSLVSVGFEQHDGWHPDFHFTPSTPVITGP